MNRPNPNSNDYHYECDSGNYTMSDCGGKITGNKIPSTSEIKISVVIDQKNLEIAVQALHNEFKLEKKNN